MISLPGCPTSTVNCWRGGSLQSRHDIKFEQQFEIKRENNVALAKNTVQIRTLAEAPAPGGAGYGTYFTSGFQSEFTT